MSFPIKFICDQVYIIAPVGCIELVVIVAAEIWVNIGSGNGLLPEDTKPLPEPILTH